jgi:hypothetical protein
MSIEDLVPREHRGIHPAYRLGFLASMRKRNIGYHPPIFAVRSDGKHVELSIGLTCSSADEDVMVVCTLFATGLPSDTERVGEPEQTVLQGGENQISRTRHAGY